jgi:hypothetical protein
MWGKPAAPPFLRWMSDVEGIRHAPSLPEL